MVKRLQEKDLEIVDETIEYRSAEDPSLIEDISEDRNLCDGKMLFYELFHRI